MFPDRGSLEGAGRSQAQSSYIGPNTVLSRALGRYKLYLDTRDISITPHILLDGYWESWISMFMIRHIRPGWRCVDIGANIGYFTLIMAELSGTDVLAFEPNPEMVDLLSKNVEINGFSGRVTIQGVALGDRETVDTLVVGDINNGGAYLKSIEDRDQWDFASTRRYPVKVMPFDSFGPIRANFVKIDVEGSELEIWDGMGELISINPEIGILLEFKNARYPSPEEFLDKILAAGFKLRVVDNDGFPQPVSKEWIIDHPSLRNLWLVRY